MANTRTNNKTKTEQEEAVVNETKASTKKAAPKYNFDDIDLDQYITVLNGTEGKLIYVSRKTGEVFEWEKMGDDQLMELSELRNAKSTYKTFFENNWFMFPEEFEWVIDYLGVRDYYKNSIAIEDFDELFNKAPDEIREVLNRLPDGQKKALAYRSYKLNSEGKIDSKKVTNVLEECLGIDLSSDGARVITNNSKEFIEIGSVH